MTDKVEITQERFDAATNGEIFAFGTAPDSPEGLHMTGSGKLLKWVAVKGWIGDWSIYCGWSHQPSYEIASNGDKVHSHELTLKVAREYQCDYVKDIEKGSTMIVKDYNLGNKGTLIIIANVI